jgi:hypothetical protein
VANKIYLRSSLVLADLVRFSVTSIDTPPRWHLQKLLGLYWEGCNGFQANSKGTSSIALILHVFAESFPILIAAGKTSWDIALAFMYEIDYITTNQTCKCRLLSQM